MTEKVLGVDFLSGTQEILSRNIVSLLRRDSGEIHLQTIVYILNTSIVTAFLLKLYMDESKHGHSCV